MISNIFNKSLAYRKFIYLIFLNSSLIFFYLMYNNFNENKIEIKISKNVIFELQNNLNYSIKNKNNKKSVKLEVTISDDSFEQVSVDDELSTEDYYNNEYYELLLKFIKNWKKSLNNKISPLITHLNNINDAHKLIVKEQQLRPFNVTQRPVSLNSSLNCLNLEYQTILNSSYRQKKVKITDLILISYELIVVEMRLFELYDIVDEIIIFETNITFKQVAKPFFFLSNLKRYKRFLDKITLITPFNITRFNKLDNT